MRLNMVFRDEIDPQELANFAEQKQWIFHGSYPATESEPAELTWASPTGVGIHLIEDEVLDLIYLSIESDSIKGTREGDLREVARSISERFETIEPQELLDLYHSEPDWNGKVLALMLVAAVAGEYSTGISEAVKSGFSSQSSDVRKAAAIASMYTPWSDLREIVEAVSRSDPDDQVRNLAATSLANFP
ncbi:HEAT repeat domain-containing protein [Streptomyces sp. 71268]|uniref:HEAT repeat domain-containing protein n=1 Tax=Streptomyces sp. 71268 TaxID=3002640 RepID=UPI0023F8377A|nr:HEAT repeat domain-containing protein [Streptomyces sp. 71268]WEV28890.1 HEAT repeat domain-containing protein [Streptomyces sp. 71268]